MPLAAALESEVVGWSREGWPGVTQTTYTLMHYWFDRTDESERFFECQQRAIETVIYCHEILRVRSLRDIFEKVSPDVLRDSKPTYDEVMSTEFVKMCLKMATGTGKTWVLIALLVWQYFNALNNEVPHEAQGKTKDWYSFRFLVVTPGHEVLGRLLDAFKGRRNETGQRNPESADFRRDLFMPPEWRSRIHLELLDPTEVRSNTTPPDGPFVFITNWQQFRLPKDTYENVTKSLWVQWTGEDVEEQPRGEFLADFLSEFPDLVVMNDEAHHVHQKDTRDEELVWRRFISMLYNQLEERHSEKKGVFVQLDFSATPFFGTGSKKLFFSHIVFDYDLSRAMRDMLVKQVFLEERQSIAGEELEALDFRAQRTRPEKGKRLGEIIGLSAGQKTLLDIGRTKLEQLTSAFRAQKVEKKPVMMILCEETEVADLVMKHLAILQDYEGNLYDDKKVLVVHTDLKENELDYARLRLNQIDNNSDPLNVVVSVLMLREGFDRKNISVIVVLRASEADLLLEQIVGRGLRLMFPKEEFPQFWQTKVETMDEIKHNKAPSSAFDFLFIVEHPRFRNFYERLKMEGYLIGAGDTSKARSTADIIPVDAMPSRLSDYDIVWPVQVFEQGKFPDISQIDVATLPRYSTLLDFEQLRKELGKMMISERHVETGKKTGTWKLENRYFNYNYFLERASKAVAEEGKATILSGHLAEVAEVIDRYVSDYLFEQHVDFSDSQNYHILNYSLIFDHVVTAVRTRLLRLMGEIQYEVTGAWNRLSNISRLMIRENYSIATPKCIYPIQAFSSVGGGFEKKFISDVLEPSVSVIAYSKLDRKHGLIIPYRDEFGILREYWVDFLIKTSDRMFLVETKSDRDIDTPNVAIKARAAKRWCETASTVKAPTIVDQPLRWEYLVMSERIFQADMGFSFEGFVALCRALRDRIISNYDATHRK